METVPIISGSNSPRRAPAGRAAQVAPIDIVSKLLAPDTTLRSALNVRAILRRDTSRLDPLLNRLIAPNVESRGRLYDAAKNLDRAKDGSSGLHVCHFIPENLALQDCLAVELLFPVPPQEKPVSTQEKPVNTILRMEHESVHARIKRLRTERGMSMAALAKAVGLRSWQTVQQWENEAKPTAPARKHQGAVAAALGVSVEELMHGAPSSAVGRAPASDRVEDRAVQLAALRRAVRAMAKDFGVSPMDLVSDEPAAMKKVAEAVGANDVEGERISGRRGMPPARPTREEANDRAPFLIKPEAPEQQRPQPVVRERRS